MTAAQLLLAQELGKPVTGVMVGATRYNVGNVAYDIRLAGTLRPGDPDLALIAMAAVSALGHAAGVQVEQMTEGLTHDAVILLRKAEAILMPSIMDGSFVKLVRALDTLKVPGLRKLQ